MSTCFLITRPICIVWYRYRELMDFKKEASESKLRHHFTAAKSIFLKSGTHKRHMSLGSVVLSYVCNSIWCHCNWLWCSNWLNFFSSLKVTIHTAPRGQRAKELLPKGPTRVCCNTVWQKIKLLGKFEFINSNIYLPCSPSMMDYPETGRGGFRQVSEFFY